MIWLLRDFDLLAVLLHAATLSLEAVAVGGVFFSLFIAGPSGIAACRGLLFGSALALAASELASLAVSAAMLIGDSGMGLHDLFSASFAWAQMASVLLALLLAFGARLRLAPRLMLLPAFALVASTVWLSHAVARMDHRLALAALTALHHLGTAAWLGAMPYLVLSLRAPDEQGVCGATRERLVRRFSKMAMLGVAVLVGAGVGLAYLYVGAWDGLYATSYGLLLLAKVYLMLLMLALGGANWWLLRHASSLPAALWLRLRRFSEAEIGIGFTVLLAAASLTSQPPATDVAQDRATRADYAQRYAPHAWPRFDTPPIAAIAQPESGDMRQAIEAQQFSGLAPSDANDIAWSEYNHHWAGVVVLAAALIALMGQLTEWRWARWWPLAFLGLAAFIVLRADPETWPLGPRPFWGSFATPDVLEHRFFALLIALFAAFECAVQTGRPSARWPALVFPGLCAVGAAVLLTHGHGAGNARDEVLADASHIGIALLGATAGWTRWLELRLAPGRARRAAGYVWPLALMLAAAVLVDYRER